MNIAVPNSNRKIRKRDSKSKLVTHIHDSSHSWLGTGTLIKKSGRVKLVLWAQTPSIRNDGVMSYFGTCVIF